jgi:hypothetical protein
MGYHCHHQAMFKKYDTDGNGSLDIKEIGAVAKVRTNVLLLSDVHGQWVNESNGTPCRALLEIGNGFAGL